MPLANKDRLPVRPVTLTIRTALFYKPILCLVPNCCVYLLTHRTMTIDSLALLPSQLLRAGTPHLHRRQTNVDFTPDVFQPFRAVWAHRTNTTAAAITALLILMTFPQRSVSQTVEYPYDAGHMPIGAYATTINNHYDMSLRRFDPDSGTWSSLKDPANGSDKNPSDYLVYGQPVRAVASGEVVTCWRNAPDSPIGSAHPRRDGCDGVCQTGAGCSCTIPQSGNHVQILTDDGLLINHAHMEPASVPTSICPHRSQFVADADDKTWPNDHTEAFVAPDDRVRVEIGQIIGRTGNSGASGGPHIHLSANRYSNAGGRIGPPVQLSFRDMRTQSIVSGSDANLTAWQDIDEETLLAHEDKLLDPPIWPGQVYARHGITSGAFRVDMGRIERSGYHLSAIDAYTVQGKTYFNYIANQKPATRRMIRGLSQSDFNDAFAVMIDDGFIPTSVEAYLNNGGKRRFAGLFAKGSGRYLSRINMTLDRHREVLARGKELGMSPISIAVVPTEDGPRFSALYRDRNHGCWDLHSRIPYSQMRDKLEEMAARGLHPRMVSGYLQDGVPHYAVIFTEMDGTDPAFSFGMSQAEYIDRFNDMADQGYLLVSASGILGAQNRHSMAAVWHRK